MLALSEDDDLVSFSSPGDGEGDGHLLALSDDSGFTAAILRRHSCTRSPCEEGSQAGPAMGKAVATERAKGGALHAGMAGPNFWRLEHGAFAFRGTFANTVGANAKEEVAAFQHLADCRSSESGTGTWMRSPP